MALLPYPCRAVAKVGGDARGAVGPKKSADIPAAPGVAKALPGCRGVRVAVVSVSPMAAARRVVV